MSSGQLKQKKSLVRWCKRMQSALSLGESEGAIDFSAMDVKWTALPRSESGRIKRTCLPRISQTTGARLSARRVATVGRSGGGGEASASHSEEGGESGGESGSKRAARQAAAAEAGEKGGGDASAAEKEVDVSVVDIRVGKIVKAWEHPEADKLWAEEIDVGLGSRCKCARFARV